MNINARRLARVIAVPAVCALALSACGGAERPSADELSESLKNGKAADVLKLPSALPDSAVDCIAEELVDSDISDEALANLMEGKDNTREEKDEDVVNDLSEDIQKCASDAMK